jgi:tetratricopeptide (TPR) repeat protein
LDYYGLMMPFSRLAPLAAAVLSTFIAYAQAQPLTDANPPSNVVPQVVNSDLDAQLFYELLMGELSARGKDPATGFALILDSARRTNDPRLYQRAMEIALQARSGESALQAARNWRLAFPDSREANRYVLQILIALNRVGDTVESLQRELAQVPAADMAQALMTVPQLYARANDRATAAKAAEEALAKELKNPLTGVEAWVTVGRMRLAAGQHKSALAAAANALAIKPSAQLPVRLALEIMSPQVPEAEALIKEYLSTYDVADLRTAYARGLLEDQRYAQAQQQLDLVTRDHPEQTEAWLILGSLQAEENQQEAGARSLQRFIDLSRQLPEGEIRERSLSQAYLGLAQLAEKRKDFAAADAWLSKVESAQLQATAQSRRASLMASQGRMDDAMKLLQNMPTGTPAEARARLTAEVQILRQEKRYQAAFDLLTEALSQAPNDVDLMYDQAMLADKLGDHDKMESLLRKIMATQPNNQNAYNALGYSLAERGVRLSEARDLIKKALEFSPGDPFISDSLGWVEFKAGNLAEAARILEKAFSAKPDPEIAAHLGEVLWSSGNKARAQAVWKQGTALSNDNETLQETIRRLQTKP